MKLADVYADIFNILSDEQGISEQLIRKREIALVKLRDVLIEKTSNAKNLSTKLLPVKVTGEMVRNILKGKLS